MCFPSNEKEPCTDSDSLSGRQVPAISHGLGKNIIPISNMSSYTYFTNILQGYLEKKIGRKELV